MNLYEFIQLKKGMLDDFQEWYETMVEDASEKIGTVEEWIDRYKSFYTDE